MLIRHSLLCDTCMIWVFGVVTRTTIVYPSCCQYWWHSVCTVHLFLILFLSFLFQYCLSIMESSSFLYFFFLFPVDDLHGCDLSECVLLVGWVVAWVLHLWLPACFYFFFPCLVCFLSFQYFFSFTCDASCDCCMLGRPKIKRVEPLRRWIKGLIVDLSAPLPLSVLSFLFPRLSFRVDSPPCTSPPTMATSTLPRFYWTGGQQSTSRLG